MAAGFVVKGDADWEVDGIYTKASSAPGTGKFFVGARRLAISVFPPRMMQPDFPIKRFELEATAAHGLFTRSSLYFLCRVASLSKKSFARDISSCLLQMHAKVSRATQRRHERKDSRYSKPQLCDAICGLEPFAHRIRVEDRRTKSHA